jgi:hypothetical protein
LNGSFEKQKKTISIENKRINQSGDEYKTKQITFRLKIVFGKTKVKIISDDREPHAYIDGMCVLKGQTIQLRV